MMRWRLLLPLLWLVPLSGSAQTCPTSLLDWTSNDIVLCENESEEFEMGDLIATSTAFGSWSWTPPGASQADTLMIDDPFSIVGTDWVNAGDIEVIFFSESDTCPLQLSVQVLGVPDASFSVVDDGFCADLPVEFDLVVDPDLDYSWNFGDGSTSSQAQPSHTYNALGPGNVSFNVQLVLVDENGCSNQSSETVSLLAVPDLGIDAFGATCVGDEEFLEYQVFLPTSYLTSWTIDWGNGDVQAGSGQGFVSTTYPEVFGFYNVTFSGTGPNGCQAVLTDDVYVGTNPQISSGNPGNTVGLCSPAYLVFEINDTENNPPGTEYYIDFGDGIINYIGPNEEIPDSVEHYYTSTSCGQTTPEGSLNAFRFRLQAENECGVSSVSVDPIRVHLAPNFTASGPIDVCSSQSFEYAATGAGVIANANSDCEFEGVFWQGTALSGQASPQIFEATETTTNIEFPEPGLYEITATSQWFGCGTGADTIEVCAYPQLQAVANALPFSGCAPLVVNLENLSPMPAICGSPEIEWTVSGGDHTFITGDEFADIAQVELLEAGTYTIEMELRIPNKWACPADFVTFSLEVFEPPTFLIGAPGQICEGESAQAAILSLDNGNTSLDGWQWSVDGTGASNTQTPLNLPTDEPGFHTVTGLATNLCGTDEHTLTYEVLPEPEITFNLPTGPDNCAGDTVEVWASGVDTYTWANSPSIISNDLNNNNVSVTGDTDIALEVAGIGANGCPTTNVFVVPMAPLPAVSLVGPTALCPGAEMVLTGTASGGSGGGYSFDWQLNGSDLPTVSDQISLSAPPTSSFFEASVEVTDGIGCSAEDSISWTTLDAPIVQAGPDTTFCLDLTGTYSLDGYNPGLSESGGSGLWTGVGLSNTGTFEPNTVGLFDAVYGYTDAQGCSATDTLLIEVVDQAPLVPGTPPEACVDAPPFHIEGYGPATASWTGNGVTPDGEVNPAAAGVGATTLMLSQGVGSCYQEETVTLVIHPLPEPLLAGPTEICDGELFTVTGSEAGGAEIFWEGAATAATDYATTASGPGATTTIDALAVSTEGCEASASWDVAVLALPQVSLAPFPTICDAGLAVTLDQGQPQGGTWSGPGVVGDEWTPVGVGSSDLVYAYQDPQTLCESSVVQTVNVQALVQADAGPDLVICDIDTTLVLVGSPDNSGFWSGDFVTGTDVLDANNLQPGDHPYVYTLGEETCETKDTLMLTVHHRPEVTIEATDMDPCPGDTVFLMATVGPLTPGPHNFQWWGNVTETDAVGDTSWAYVLVTDDGLLPVTVFVTDDNGCSRLETLTLDPWALPVVDAGADVTLCNQPPAEPLTGAPLGGLWSGSAALSGDLFDPAAAGIGSYVLTYTYTDAFTGCTASDSLVVEVEEPQFASAGDDLWFCDIDTVGALSGFGPVGGTWSGTGVEDSGAFALDPLTPDTYEWVYTYGTGTCETKDTLAVTILANPEVTLAASPEFCDGDSILFSNTTTGGNGLLTYTWGGDLTVLSDAEAVVVADTAMGPFFTGAITVADTAGCIAFDTTQVIIHALPEVDAGPDTLFCNQSIVAELEGFSPLNAWWTGADQLSEDGTFLPDTTGIFSAVLTFEDSNTCKNTDSLTITVTEPQYADAGPATMAFCDIDSTGMLTGFTPATGGAWSGPGIAAAGGDFAIEPLVPGEYVWLFEFGQGTCYTRDSIEVTIHENPEVLLLAEDNQVCDGQTAVFAAPATDGLPPYNWTWSDNVMPTAPDSATATVDVNNNPLEVDVTVTDANGCSATATTSVSVLSLPVVNAGLDTTLCATGIEATLNGSSMPANGNGAWQSPDGGVIDAGGVVSTGLTGAWSAIYTFTQDVTGCVNSDTLQVEVIDAVQVAAGPDTVACFNAPPVTFAGVSPVSGVSWVPVDPATSVSSEGQVAPAALGPGIHAFEALYGVATCLTRDTVEIEVLDLPAISMPAAEAFCGNLGVQTLGAAGPAGGVWFGTGIVDAANGDFDTEMVPATYTPGYHYTDPLTGCRDTAYHAVDVHPVPTAAFDLPALGCVDVPVDLAQQSSGFSDQTFSFPPFPPSPNFAYPAPGDYTVGLLVENEFGCADSTTGDITITIPPTADFSVSTDFGCTPLDVSFTDLSTAPFCDTTWTLDGVVQPGSSLPPMTFDAVGDLAEYEVALTVDNLCGTSTATETIGVFPEPEAAFVIPEDTVCSPYPLVVLDTSPGLPDAWAWDFGNGETDLAQTPAGTTYLADSLPAVYDITLEVSNACGADDTTLTITVLPNAVTAFFTTNTSGGCAPFTLEVTDVSDETVFVSYDFGNGDFSSSTPVATTTYDAPGTYLVQQFVSDGCSADTTATTIVVSESPAVSLSASPAACASEPFTFDAAVSTPIGSASWTFGDGDGQSGLVASHTYAAGGDYWAVFSAESALNGCPAADSVLVTVYPVPDVAWTPSEAMGCSPFTVAFDNASTGAGLVYAWDFGDGPNGSTTAEPTHTYTNTSGAPVLVDVELTATNAFTCQASLSGQISVLPAPLAAFTLDAEESCTFPVGIGVTNNSVGSISHAWNWTGGTIVEAYEPTGLTADGIGTYTLTLTATNAWSCSATAAHDFTVHEAPVAGFTVNPTFGCNPLSLSFNNTSSNAATATLNIPGIYQGPLPAGNLVIDQVGTYVANLAVTSPEGCADDITLAGGVQVFPVPTAGFTVTPFADVPENTVFTFDNMSSTEFMLNWDFGDGSAAGSGATTTHEYAGSGLFDVTLTAINNYGCAATHTETVDVGATLMVFAPTAFTPGGQGDFGIARPDGINDGWRPEIRGIEHVDQYWLQVFNRWGDVVWETRDPAAVWDGGMPGEVGERFYTQDEVLNWRLRLSTSGDVKFDGGDGADDGSRSYRGIVTILR